MNRDEAIKELQGWRSTAIFDGEKAQSMKEANPELDEALGLAIEAMQPWRVITKRPMTDEERIAVEESLGCDIEDEDAVVFGNLPEDGKEVLVCTWYGHIYIDTLYSDDQGCYFEDAGDMEGVIAWMPLPEPYKEAKDEH